MGDKLAKSKNLCCHLVVFTRYSLLMGWLLVLDLKEGLVECATMCVKSVVILLFLEDAGAIVVTF